MSEESETSLHHERLDWEWELYIKHKNEAVVPTETAEREM